MVWWGCSEAIFLVVVVVMTGLVGCANCFQIPSTLDLDIKGNEKGKLATQKDKQDNVIPCLLSALSCKGPVTGKETEGIRQLTPHAWR